MRVSYSGLEMYQRCPYLFKHIYIDHQKIPKTKEAVFGSSVHNALKYAFTRNPVFPTLHEIINYFYKEWDAKKVNIPFKDEYEEKMLLKNGEDILKKFYAKNPPWNFTVLDLESRFEAPIKDAASNEEHILSGIIDRIDKDNEGIYHIIDYKTGRRLPSQDTVDKNLQLAIYHLGFLRRWPQFGQKKILLSLYYLQHGEQVTTWHTEKALQDIKLKIISLIRQIQKSIKENEWPALSSPLCALHPYNKICPMWSHLYYKKDLIAEVTHDEAQKLLHEYISLKFASQQTASKMKELQATLLTYMKANNFDRFFGDEGYVTRNIKTTPLYDFEKIKPILESIDKWSAIIKPDEKKLDKLLPFLPFDTQQKIKEAILKIRKTESLLMRRKKIEAE